jgi:hypothetical protein
VKRIDAAGATGLPLTWDLADLDAVDAHVSTVEKALGPVDILVNNTGGPGAAGDRARHGRSRTRPRHRAHCYQVAVGEAMDYVAGVVPVLDQTAEEILLENPRYLTRVKNYPTFFSFGPDLITLDEVLAAGPLSELRVATMHNGAVHRQDTVAGMTFSPAELLSFHSHVMPFCPRDILSTGTPGAVPIASGDIVGCELGDRLASLTNPVR